ncbi:MAG TPA: DUF2934 domain-containing protein [Candidatus Polarisedimenticolia bacterium]|jgi:hypothetical protein|nr:DUF2934 domain-containing protein [Candidatus Polarisedimenticolia bacterium]
MLDKPRKGSGTTRKTAGRTPAAKGAARTQAASPSSNLPVTTVSDAPPAFNPAAPRTYASSAPVATRVSADERRRMIAEAAYYKAARRGFAAGDPDRDWIEAEAEIDARLIER